MTKQFKGFRFEPNLYEEFGHLALKGGFTITGAFERFMNCCVERGSLVFPESGVLGLESEARVLVDWLRKGKRFYRDDVGTELNIAGKLICLLPKVQDAALRAEIEQQLKSSVNQQK